MYQAEFTIEVNGCIDSMERLVSNIKPQKWIEYGISKLNLSDTNYSWKVHL